MPDFAKEVRARLSSLRLSPTREAEIVDELSQHLDDRYRELVAGGSSPEDAVSLTFAEFRSSDALARHMAPLRQAHAPTPAIPAAPTGQLITDLWQDVRYATRLFRKQPGFTATAVLTLALGIGATTAIFSVVYGVLLKPLPFHEPERLVSLLHTVPDGGRNHGPATYFTYLDNQRAFEGVGAWETNEVSLTGRGDPERVDVLSVSDATLPLLRVQPILGRLFNAADDTAGAPLRAVLAHGYWQRRFGGDAQVIGQSLSIDGVSAEVIGVLPASFRFLSKKTPALLLPMQVDRSRAGFIEFDFQVLARLKPGVTLPQANADVGRMIPLLPQPFARLQMQPNVQPLVDSVTGDVGRILWILLAAAGVVLLIACGNVANLFLIRAEGRQQELAMRAALGASRGRIARVLLTESVLLALAGGALAVAFAQAAIGILQQAAPVNLPRVEEIAIDLHVLLFTMGISVLSGLMFGLFAVARFGTPGVAALKEGGRSSSDGPARLRARNALVVAQVSLALVLMVVSGLMVRTFIALRQVQPGFTQPSDVQTFRLDVPDGVVADPREAARTYERIAERLGAVPGVTAVGLSSSITMDGEDNGNSVDVEDFPVPEGQLSPLWRFKSFGPGYFETMGNRVVAGRSVTWTEIHEERPVILISAALAREYWKEPSRALGKRVRTGPQQPWREIIGVVGDERDDGLNHPATKIVYWPLLNDSYEWRALAFALRSARAGDATFLREVQQAVWSVNPNLPLATVQTLEEIQAHSMAQTSFAMAILGIAASVALLLGIVGIYGAIAYIATERTREIGIRIALGAQIGDVRRLFLRQGLWLTATGIALGVVVALALSRVMSALLFGVGPADPLTYVAVSAALGAVAVLATYLPARRASRVDPIVALRADSM